MRIPANQQVTLKNLTSGTRFFSLGRGIRGVNLAAGQVKTVPVLPESMALILQYESEGSLALVGGPPAFARFGSLSMPIYAVVRFSGAAANADTVTVQTTLNDAECIFEWAATAEEVQAGNIWVGAGAAAATAAAALVAAVNAKTTLLGVVAEAPVTVDTEVVVVIRANYAKYETLGWQVLVSGSNLARDPFFLGYYGRSAQSFIGTVTVEEAQENAGMVILPTTLGSIGDVVVTVRLADGTFVPFDGGMQINGSTIILTPGTNALLEEGDKVTVLATDGGVSKAANLGSGA